MLPSPIHNYYQNIEQINGGANNKFVAMSTVGAWVMGYFDGSQMKLWKWAREYTLADHFFMGAFGGSYLNHQWLICACTPVFADAPARLRPQLDDNGRLKKQASSPASVMNGPVQVFDGSVTPDGFTVNTLQPPYQPSGIAPAKVATWRLPTRARHRYRRNHARPSATRCAPRASVGPGTPAAGMRPLPTAAARRARSAT